MGRKNQMTVNHIRRVVCALTAAGALILFPGCATTEGDPAQEAEAGQNGLETEAFGPEREQDDQALSNDFTGGNAEEGNGGERNGDDISGLLSSWDFDRKSISLEEVLQDLDQRGIRYTGYYNVSGERLDLTLEDETELVFFQIRDDSGNPLDDYELMMKGTQFNANGFQEHYLGALDVITEEPFYPDLSAGLVEESDLWSLNQTDLAIARNQIFARHGRKFQDPFLNALFGTKSWYEPLYDGAEFDAGGQEMLSETERENLNRTLEIERIMNYQGGGEYETAHALMSGSWVDLDGDGVRERIVYERQLEEDNDIGFWNLQIDPGSGNGEGGAGARVHVETVNPYSNCYLASQDGVHWHVILSASGFSDDPVCRFYRYEAGGLTETGEIFAGAQELKIYPDRIMAPVEYQHFQCQPIEREYVTENGELVQVEKDYYPYAGNTAAVCRQIPLLKEDNREEGGPLLEEGDRIIVCGGDLSEWVLLEKEATGERGWLRVTDSSECCLPDGSTGYSWEWFEGLPFYG